MTSRLSQCPPDVLDEQQKAFYRELQDIIDASFGDIFETTASDGSFIGPFGVFIHNPSLGKMFFATMIELAKLPGLPLSARQTIILTTAAHYESEYPKYAHSRLTLRRTDILQEDVDAILAGRRPEGLDEKCRVTHDLAKALLEKPGPLKDGVWERAEKTLGTDGTAAAVHFVGFYAYTCILLNGFDAKAPADKP